MSAVEIGESSVAGEWFTNPTNVEMVSFRCSKDEIYNVSNFELSVLKCISTCYPVEMTYSMCKMH